MADVVRMGAPVYFHLGKDVGLIDFLRLRDRLLDRFAPGLVNLRVLLDVETIDRGGDSLSGFFLVRICLAQRAHSLSLDVGQGRIDEAGEKGQIHRAVRIAEDMARAVMAVDTIHSVQLDLFRLLGGEGNGTIEILRDPSLAVFDPHPGNLLPLRIRGAVPHLVGNIHVPVDSCGDPGGWAAPADAQQASNLPYAVFLVVAKSGDDFELGAEKFFRPVTLFAGFLGRSEAVNRSRNRARIFIKKNRINLVSPGQLGSNILAGSRSHMTLGASHARMGRFLVSGVLRLHGRMTKLAAKRHRLGKMIGLVAERGNDTNQQNG